MDFQISFTALLWAASFATYVAVMAKEGQDWYIAFTFRAVSAFIIGYIVFVFVAPIFIASILAYIFLDPAFAKRSIRKMLQKKALLA